MSENDATTTAGGKANSAWTDRERLVYLIVLIETSSAKFEFANAPRPQGRSLIACQRMVDRLKTAYKDDIDALKAGNYVPDAGDGAPKTPKTPKTPRTVKRKVKDVDGETGAEETPKKRGRKKKVSEETVQTEDDANEAGDVKAEEE